MYDKMPKKKTPYGCPRCGYTTIQKGDMRKHLHNLLKPCPQSENNIDLTEQIKDCIMKNRVYHIPKQTQTQILIQQINNNQQINNFVSKMDTFEKIRKLNDKATTSLLTFDEQIQKDFEDDIYSFSMVETGLDELSIRKGNILGIIDKLTKYDNMDTMNVVYDKTPNKLSIFDEGDWETYAFEHGVVQLLHKIKTTYLDNYEEFLLDKLSMDDYPRERQKAKELLQEYYNFIVSFDLRPLIVECKTTKIIDYNEQYYKIYDKVKNNIKLSHAKELKRNVYQMVKNNCSASMLELNKRMMDIICTDEEFKNTVLQRISLTS
jgi:hypothetical protein